MPTNDEELQILNKWSQDLAQALQIPDLPIDHEILLDLARKSAWLGPRVEVQCLCDPSMVCVNP